MFTVRRVDPLTKRPPPPGRRGARWAGNGAEPRTVPESPAHGHPKTDEKRPVAMKFNLVIWQPPLRLTELPLTAPHTSPGCGGVVGAQR